MNDSQNGSLSLAGSSVCPSCGNVTYLHADTVSSNKKGILYVMIGWLFTFISVLFVPIIFGAIAIYMGFKTFSHRSKTHGVILMVFASIGLILGSYISIMVSGTLFI